MVMQQQYYCIFRHSYARLRMTIYKGLWMITNLRLPLGSVWNQVLSPHVNPQEFIHVHWVMELQICNLHSICSIYSLLTRMLGAKLLSKTLHVIWTWQLIAEFILTSAYRTGIPKLDVYRGQERMYTRRGTWAFHLGKAKDVGWWQVEFVIAWEFNASFPCLQVQERGREKFWQNSLTEHC